MAKKRRQAHRAPAVMNRQGLVDTEATEKKLQQLEEFYGQLSADVVEIPTSLERSLVFHSIVTLVVQNALMYAESVSMEQIALVVGTAVWMTRGVAVTGLLPHIALQDSSSRVVFWRSVIHCLVVAGLGAVTYRFEVPLVTLRSGIFLLVFLLDAVSIHFVRRSNGRFTRRQIVLSAIETTFLVAGFSTHFNYRSELIYDGLAFALTAATTFIHVIVLLSAEYAAFHCFATDTNGKFAKAQRRGKKLMENLWQSVDRFEPEQLFAGLSGASKKKKTKSKSRAIFKSASEIWLLAKSQPSTRQSVFNEPRVQFAILTLIQMLLLISQVLLSAFVLYSWEMISALMLSSSHVLLVLGRVRRKVLARNMVSSRAPELSKHKTE